MSNHELLVSICLIGIFLRISLVYAGFDGGDSLESFDNISSQSFCSKYQNLYKLVKDNKIHGSEGLQGENSKITEIFANLKAANALKVQTNGMKTPCYFWECTNEKKYKNKQCVWCLPYAVIAGFSKCGTTALSNTLMEHPDIRFYNNRKEIKLFASTKTSELRRFESRIKAGDFNITDTTKLWIEATASLAYSEEGIRALFTFSPQTKIIMLVRDPYQRLASWLSMVYKDDLIKQNHPRVDSSGYVLWLSRKLRHSKMLEMNYTYPYLDSQSLQNDSFSFSSLKRITGGTSLGYFLHAEILLSWKDRFKDLLIIDHFNLLNKPDEIINNVEDFLNINHHHYPDGIIDNRVNIVGVWKNAYNLTTLKSGKSGKAIGEAEHIYKFQTVIRDHLHKWFLPSLCLFEWVFGWHSLV